MFGSNRQSRGLNPSVAKALAGMGVDPNHKEKALREERGRVMPKVAAVLESLGIRVPKEDIVSEEEVNEAGTSPLDMPGQAPGVDPNKGQPNGMGPQNKAPGAPTGQQKPDQGQKPGEKPDVKLKKPATSMNTLQDVADKMTEVTAGIKTVDLLIQALTENKTSDNSIKTHKLTLRGPIQQVVNSINDLKKLVE
jgi:hypothetical protein